MNPPRSPFNNAEQDAPSPPPAPPAPEQREEPKGSGTTTATAPSRAKTPPVSRPLDMYKVLLHNDDVSDPMVVVRSIVEIVSLATERAFSVMAEAEQTGVSLVVVTHLERAELFQEQLQSKGLTITLEKA
jgi:ATP-dependent Clp protease adaptor protein ClpS